MLIEKAPADRYQIAAEDALRKVHEEYRSIVDNAVFGIFRSTPKGRLIAANPALARIYGYDSPEELIAAFTDIPGRVYVDPARRREFGRLLLERGAASRFESEVYRKDGTRMWVSMSARAVRDDDGTIQYYEGMIEDVTERKQSETTLQRQKELLQTIFDHMPCMFNVLGPDNRPMLVNREWTRVMGWTAEELSGQDLLALLHPDPQERRRTDEFIRASDRSWSDFRNRVKDGRLIDTCWANFRLSDGTLIGIGQDVTERKRAQRTLQARAMQQAAIADLGQQALAGDSLDTVLAKAARRVAETLDVEGSGVLRVLPGGRELLLVAGMGFGPGVVGKERIRLGPRSLSGGSVMVKMPLVVPDVRKDKRFRASLLRAQGAVSAASIVIGHADRPFGVLNAFTRVERVFSEDDLRFLQAIANVLALAIIRRDEEDVRHQLLERLLGAQEEERRRIARELHDEAGQALTSLLVGLRVLEGSSSLRRAASQAARLRRLAARTMDGLGRLARGLTPIVLEHLGLRPALRRLASEQAEALGFSIAVDTRRFGTARLPPEMETALYRIAQEAVANVGRHAKARRVTIVLTRANGTVRLAVRDDGRGFDAESTMRASVRAGRLGLHGMRERAVLLGGTLHVESKRRKGTTVSVRVPVAGPSPGGVAAVRARPRKAS